MCNSIELARNLMEKEDIMHMNMMLMYFVKLNSYLTLNRKLTIIKVPYEILM